MIKTDIGEKIRYLRIQKNMTQKELGEKLGGIPQQQIGRWENGKSNPKLNTLQKIAAALSVNVNDLLESPLDDSPLYKAFKNANPSDYPIGKDLINAQLAKQVDDWEQIDIELVKTFKKLNENGKAVAIERVEELAEIPRYIQKEEH
ncbi:helix-turn-helix domain-containing protein [Petralouisia muris]|uniref:Helix-turn-helix domain-containing protein n=1 Tax=Petralouisia muris TaxID=3032872 RepID=A0AC61RYP6_9FIRM|nr:helix-turn-helix domain-containing protein [Petralouisia muris]TGY96881.1 helix-turn-helix domain-containing protein [Petralouisia muris]